MSSVRLFSFSKIALIFSFLDSYVIFYLVMVYSHYGINASLFSNPTVGVGQLAPKLQRYFS